MSFFAAKRELNGAYSDVDEAHHTHTHTRVYKLQRKLQVWKGSSMNLDAMFFLSSHCGARVLGRGILVIE